jgi:hypothetical protein
MFHHVLLLFGHYARCFYSSRRKAKKRGKKRGYFHGKIVGGGAVAELTEKQRAALAAGRKPFTSTNQPENRGRKPSKLKKWAKEFNVGVADYRAIFNNLIACKTVEELQDMIKKGKVEKLPVIVVACAAAVVDDIQHGRLTWTNTLLDRVIGKAIQQIEIGSNRDDIPDDPEERRALAEAFRAELALNNPPTPNVKASKLNQEKKPEDA